MGGAVLDRQEDGVPQFLGRFGLEHGQLALLGHCEDLGGLAFAGGVALAEVPVDDDLHGAVAGAVTRRR